MKIGGLNVTAKAADITLKDNDSTALELKSSDGKVYMTLDTTNGTENLQINQQALMILSKLI